MFPFLNWASLPKSPLIPPSEANVAKVFSFFFATNRFEGGIKGERTPKRGHKQMKKTSKVRKSLSAASAGVLAFALSASAGVRTVKPSPSDFIDTEASTNLVFAPLLEDTRQYRLRFTGDFSPSNDLEVAFGGDANGDGDLSPVEVETQFGIDCGEKKVKVLGEGEPEVKVIGEGELWGDSPS